MDIINQASTQCQPVGEQLSLEGSGVPASVITVDRGSKKFKQAIQNDEDKKPISNCINVFFELFGIFAILRQCNIRARGHGGTGISPAAMFRFLFEQVFRDRSIYQLEKEGKLPEGVSTSSVSRFLAHKGYNWEKFLSVLGSKAVEYIQVLNDPGKVAGLAMDDTDYDRNPRKKQVDYCPGKPNKKKKKSRSDKGRRTEFASKKYDHARHVHSKGYRMLTVIWTDATAVIPLAFCLLASMKDDKICGSILDFAKRTLQYKRRKLARSKTTDVMVTLLNRALKSVKATWVAADRWFSDPASILRIKNECKIDVITPLKHNKPSMNITVAK